MRTKNKIASWRYDLRHANIRSKVKRLTQKVERQKAKGIIKDYFKTSRC